MNDDIHLLHKFFSYLGQKSDDFKDIDSACISTNDKTTKAIYLIIKRQKEYLEEQTVQDGKSTFSENQIQEQHSVIDEQHFQNEKVSNKQTTDSQMAKQAKTTPGWGSIQKDTTHKPSSSKHSSAGISQKSKHIKKPIHKVTTVSVNSKHLHVKKKIMTIIDTIEEEDLKVVRLHFDMDSLALDVAFATTSKFFNKIQE